ncbi:MAG TPA: glycosyl hydrolase family 8 [Solirubrobacteraceae bacterium]|nr:glycosyl hydrolase family 8 [Solirubrobacteraceae bacterium]
MSWRSLLIVCALSAGLAGCGAGSSHSRSTSAGAGAGATGRERRAGSSPTDAAEAFLATYANPDGRVVRIDQGGDTVSEGQAYGMLIAAAIGDRKRFTEIWNWTRTHLQDRSGLFAFHWQNGHVVDAQPATDADLDIARALLVGACRFGDPSLRTEAVRVGRAILAHEVARAGSLQVLIAGPWANHGANLVFNPSYVDPTTLNALAKASGDRRFSTVAADGTQLVNELTRPLPPDWAIVDTKTGQPAPVSGASSTNGPGMFTYDAPRTLVRFAEAPVASQTAAVARAWSVFSATPAADIVTEHQLSGQPAGSDKNPVTLAGVAGAAKAAGASSAVGGLLNEAQTWNAQHPTYYGSAWVALGRLLLTTNLLQPCSG